LFKIAQKYKTLYMTIKVRLYSSKQGGTFCSSSTIQRKKLSHFNEKAQHFCTTESDVAPQYRIFKAPTSTFYIVCHVPQQLLRFHGNNGYADAPQRFVIGTLPFLLDGSVV